MITSSAAALVQQLTHRPLQTLSPTSWAFTGEICITFCTELDNVLGVISAWVFITLSASVIHATFPPSCELSE